MKKPASGRQELETLQIPRAERVLLLKLQDTNQKLCKVTQLWKDSNRQVAYLNNQYKKALTEIELKDRHFEAVSHKNIQEYQKREQELHKTNLTQLHEINTLTVERARAKQVFDHENAEKIRWSDQAKDLQQKLDKVISTRDKDVKDLHEVIQKQEEKLVERYQLRENLHAEVNEYLDKQIQLNDQLLIVSTEKEFLKQEFEALTASLDADSRGLKVRNWEPISSISTGEKSRFKWSLVTNRKMRIRKFHLKTPKCQENLI